MYRTRFQDSPSRRLFELKGRFTLLYVGNGTFVYGLPGRERPIVGKIELGRKKYHRQGLRFLTATVLLLGLTSYVSNTVATSLSDTDLNANLTPRELEQRSEELKARILRGERTEGETPVIAHIVEQGDTLEKLAAKYKVSAQLIAASSKIVEGALKPGTKLTIPGKQGLIYTVKAGDSLAQVTDHYSVKLDAVIAANPDLADLDLLPPGVTVFLPDAKIPIPPPVWMRPIWGFFTSGFGMRPHPFLGGLQWHPGLDISANYQNVGAARGGVIIFAGYLGSYGNAVVIDHGGGFKTLYAHLSKVLVRPGQSVSAGGLIAVSGNTGMSTGPHLHFEIIVGGSPVNPLIYMK